MSDWFSVKFEVRQGCVTSPWFFNFNLDRVVREVQARTLGRAAQLVGDGDEK